MTEFFLDINEKERGMIYFRSSEEGFILEPVREYNAGSNGNEDWRQIRDLSLIPFEIKLWEITTCRIDEVIIHSTSDVIEKLIVSVLERNGWL